MGNNREYKQVARYLFESRDLSASASLAASGVSSPGQPDEQVASPEQAAEPVAEPVAEQVAEEQSGEKIELDLAVESAGESPAGSA